MTPKPATGAKAVPVKGRAAETRTPDTAGDGSDLVAENARLRSALQDAEQLIVALRAESREDPLTGLLNRRGFDAELERAFDMVRRYGSDAALLYVDLDEFKAINDRHGHAAGDMALMHVAALLVANVRRSDVVSRIGGDEFAIVLWHSTLGEAQAKAQMLVAALATTPFEAGGHRIPIAASIGFSVIDAEDSGPDAVMSRADKAMYAIKKARP